VWDSNEGNVMTHGKPGIDRILSALDRQRKQHRRLLDAIHVAWTQGEVFPRSRLTLILSADN
jgi:hypothetical protein